MSRNLYENPFTAETSLVVLGLKSEKSCGLMRKTTLTSTLITVLLITLLLLSFVPSLKADSAAMHLEWSKRWSRPSRSVNVGTFDSPVTHVDRGYSVIQTSDGGYVIVGVLSDSYYPGRGTPNANYSGVIIKTDPLGELQWEKTFPYTGFPSKVFLQVTQDSGFVVCMGGKLFKFDAEGNLKLSRSFRMSVETAIQVNDGGYVVTLVDRVASNAEAGTWIVKIDEKGYRLWEKTLSVYNPSDVLTFDISETNNESYVAIGTWSNPMYWTFTTNLWLTRIDSNAELQLNKTYNLFNNPSHQSSPQSVPVISGTIHVTEDGGFILSGGLNSNGKSPWLAKIDASGDMEWIKKYADGYSDNSYFASSVQTKDGGYFAVGFYSGAQPSDRNTDVYAPLLVKTDSNGNLQWNMTYDSALWDTGDAQFVTATREGEYVVTGSVNGDLWLAKFSEIAILPAGPLTIFAVIVAVVIISGAGLLVYLIKRK